MEAIERDYAPRGIRFYYIYTSLAHEGRSGYFAPYTLDERLLHIRRAKQLFNSRVTWLADAMDDAARSALGDQPNAEFVVDPQMRIVRARSLSRPAKLRQYLVELAGPVDSPTRVEDLDTTVNWDIVSTDDDWSIAPRVKLPGNMQSVRVEPQIMAGASNFVKLQAMVEPRVLNGRRRGWLYVGFFLDRVYGIHWNNLERPLRFRIEGGKGLAATPQHGTAPEIDVAVDAEPREFLIDLVLDESAHDYPLKLTIDYFVCDDSGTFCQPAAQTFLIHMEPGEGIQWPHWYAGTPSPDILSELSSPDQPFSAGEVWR